MAFNPNQPRDARGRFATGGARQAAPVAFSGPTIRVTPMLPGSSQFADISKRQGATSRGLTKAAQERQAILAGIDQRRYNSPARGAEPVQEALRRAAGDTHTARIHGMPTTLDLNASVSSQAQPYYKDHAVYHVDAAKADALWAKDKNFHVSETGIGGSATKLTRAKEFIGAGNQFKAPAMGISANGRVNFDDGRHRFAAMRAMGLDRIPVSMDAASARNAKKLGLIK